MITRYIQKSKVECACMLPICMMYDAISTFYEQYFTWRKGKQTNQLIGIKKKREKLTGLENRISNLKQSSTKCTNPLINQDTNTSSALLSVNHFLI